MLFRKDNNKKKYIYIHVFPFSYTVEKQSGCYFIFFYLLLLAKEQAKCYTKLFLVCMSVLKKGVTLFILINLLLVINLTMIV